MLRKFSIAVVVCGLAVSLTTMANASLEVRLTSGGSTSVADNGAGDLDPVLGQILFSGGVGAFTTNIEIAKSKPSIGTAAYPQLDLNSSNVSSAAGGTLTIEVTDTDFGPSTNPLGFLASLASTFPGTGLVSLDVYIDLGNTPFAQTTLLAHVGDLTTFGSFGVLDALGSAPTNAAYSLTLVATLTHAAAGTSSFVASLSAVPEPTSVLVWASLAMVSLAAGRRNRD